MKILVATFALLLLPIIVARSASADTDIVGPAPESAEELITHFDRGLEGGDAVETPVDEILDNSHLKLQLRNYYLSRTRPENTDPRAWAQGAALDYQVDKIGGIFGFHTTFFGSYKLYGPEEHDGTLLLEPGQEDINTLGVLNPKATMGGNVLSLFRQRIDLPFVNSQDNRVVPNTFEAYLLAMTRAENEKFQYVLGYISDMKKRNEENFDSMSEVAGVTSGERGMIVSGARYYFIPELSLGGINYYVDDILNIFYTEAVHKKKINEDVANTLSLQYADQRSTGDELLRGEEFSTNFWGIQNALSYKNVTAKMAYTYNDTGGDIRSPYGSYPGFNSSIVEDFNRAGEKSWQVGLSYNFARLGLKGLGLTTAYIHGLDAINETDKTPLPDKKETDVTVDYKVDEGLLKGFWLRLRGAFIDEEEGQTTKDFRIIVNYEIPLYEPSSSDAKT